MLACLARLLITHFVWVEVIELVSLQGDLSILRGHMQIVFGGLAT